MPGTIVPVPTVNVYGGVQVLVGVGVGVGVKVAVAVAVAVAVKVMVAVQKSNVAFQAATQVRNRLVTAYQDIMNMPI